MTIDASLSDALAENAKLRKENEELKSSLIEQQVSLPRGWKLTQVEQTIFRALLKSESLSKKTIVQILYGGDANASSLKNIDVFIARIRSKTRSDGVVIETIFGVGYRLIDREAWTKALAARLAG